MRGERNRAGPRTPSSPLDEGGQEVFGEHERELDQNAERYPELHGGDDEAKPWPGFLARIHGRLRGLAPRERAEHLRHGLRVPDPAAGIALGARQLCGDIAQPTQERERAGIEL